MAVRAAMTYDCDIASPSAQRILHPDRMPDRSDSLAMWASPPVGTFQVCRHVLCPPTATHIAVLAEVDLGDGGVGDVALYGGRLPRPHPRAGWTYTVCEFVPPSTRDRRRRRRGKRHSSHRNRPVRGTTVTSIRFRSGTWEYRAAEEDVYGTAPEIGFDAEGGIVARVPKALLPWIFRDAFREHTRRPA